jgi:hypothetical protein
MGITNINELVQKSVDESYDDEDVPAALERKTDDGPGDLTAIPESDFEEDDQ